MEQRYLQHLLDKVHRFGHCTEGRVIEAAKQRHHKKRESALFEMIQNRYSVIMWILASFR
jgi:hypothetical protein